MLLDKQAHLRDDGLNFTGLFPFATVEPVIKATASGVQRSASTSEVSATGRNARLGRFIELRDAYGDTYIYAKLGRVLERYTRLAHASRWGPRNPHARQAGKTRPVPLRKGAWVTSGTVLGSVRGATPGTQAHFLFEIRPAGAGPIDPRPILQAWQALGDVELSSESDAMRALNPRVFSLMVDIATK